MSTRSQHQNQHLTLCQQNTSVPILFNNLREDLNLNIQLLWFPNNMDHLASLQSEYTMQLNASGNDIQTSSSVQQHHEGTQTRSQASSKFPKGEDILLPHHPFFSEPCSLARLWIAFGGSAKPTNGISPHKIMISL